MKLSRRGLLAVTITAPLAGCATLPGDFEKPRISVAGLRLVEIALLEQRYELRLRVQNPNDFGFEVTGMAYHLEVNGREFASGVSDRHVDVPAYGQRRFTVPVTSSLADLVEQLRSLQGDRASGLNYRIHGHLRIKGMPGRVDFDHADQLLPGRSDPPDSGGVIRST